MARDISVTIAVQGEKEYAQALRDAQSAVKLLESELKASEASFGDNADAQERYANRTRLIGAQIEQQKTILKSLEGAIREASDEFGEGSAKTDKYRIAANRTQASIAQLERSLRETQEEAEELGRDSMRIGRQLEDGIGDAADDVSDKLDGMIKSLESDLSGIGRSVDISALTDVGGAISDVFGRAYSAVTGLVDEGASRMQLFGFLRTNAEAAGHDYDEVERQVTRITSVTGDMEGAIEGVNALLRAGFDADELDKSVERLLGAYTTLPGIVSFEGMAEGLLESIGTGSAAGQYAQILEQNGAQMDLINAALEAARKTSSEAAQTAALALLSEWGFEDRLAAFEENESDLIEYREAGTEFEKAKLALARELTPTASALTATGAGALNMAADALAGLRESREAADREMEQIDADTGYYTKLAEINAQIAAADRAGDQLQAQRLVNVRTAMREVFVDYLQDELDRDTFLERLDEIGREGVEVLNRSINDESARVTSRSIADRILGIGVARADEGEESMASDAVDAVSGAAADLPPQMLEVGGTAGAELIAGARAAIAELEPELLESVNVLGQNAVIEASNGMTAQTDAIVSTAAAIHSRVEEMLGQEIVIPVSVALPSGNASASGYLTGTMGGSVNLNTSTTVTLDGRSIGKATTSTVDGGMGAAAQRASTYGR